MRDVLLAGAFGQGNPGDEALLASFLDAIGHDRAVVTSRDPVHTMATFGCEAVRPTAAAAGRWLHRGTHLVVGGGTIFKSLHPASGRRPTDLLARTWALVRTARSFGARVSLVGVGAADLTGAAPRRLARAIAKRSDLLVFRDDESAAVLTRAGLPPPFRVGADAAWTRFTGHRVPAARRDLDVVVALSHLAAGRELAGHLTRALAPALDAGRAIALQPWQTGGPEADRELARAVAAGLGGRVEIIDPPADLLTAASTFARARLVVGLRFHALMSAAAAGTPFLAVAHEPKLAALARRFDQLSVPGHAAPPVLARAITTGDHRPAPDPHVVATEVERADEGFRLLGLVLDGGTPEHLAELRGLPLASGVATW